MADVEVNVNINATKRSADTFAENIASGLQKSMGKLGLGSAISVGKGGAMGPGLKEGVAAGLAAGGVVGLLGMIADSLKDMPIIVGIMKIFKLILMLLFLPLIPILKPVLQALADLAKNFAPVIKKLTQAGSKGAEEAPQIAKTGNGLIDAFVSVANAALRVGGAIGQMIFDIGAGAFKLGEQIGQWLYDKVILPVGNFISKIIIEVGTAISNAILKAFDWVKGIGEKIWTTLLKPGFNYLSDIGLKIWNYLKSIFKGTINVVTEVWAWLKSFFKGSIDAVSEIWNFIKSLFKGSISVASTVWNFIQSLFPGGSSKKGKQLGGPIATEGVYYLHRGERVLSATERNNGGTSGMNITLNIHNPVISQKSDINELVSQIEDKLKTGMRRRVSYGPRNF